MAKSTNPYLDELTIHKHKADELVAGRREEANKLLNQWKIENFGTTDVRVTPPKEALPAWAWPYIKRADASDTSRDGLKIAQADKEDIKTPDNFGLEDMPPEFQERWREMLIRHQIKKEEEKNKKK